MEDVEAFPHPGHPALPQRCGRFARQLYAEHAARLSDSQRQCDRSAAAVCSNYDGTADCRRFARQLYAQEAHSAAVQSSTAAVALVAAAVCGTYIGKAALSPCPIPVHPKIMDMLATWGLFLGTRGILDLPLPRATIAPVILVSVNREDAEKTEIARKPSCWCRVGAVRVLAPSSASTSTSPHPHLKHEFDFGAAYAPTTPCGACHVYVFSSLLA
ncbi:hypothetical protein B0H10DRAFT_1964128 [Mycena sp. CBHHK59/15]|nr:hypothetical protein B0H10DRAFT_1964128 [Mycena sp. CBHHK59/15]